VTPVRCAVYTRKSSEEGLEQSFNSLHAQREACEAYVLSQKHEGWRLVPTAYDDGGYSGGSMERPALKALLADVEAGLVDTVVVYKVDRLTRSLADFAEMVKRFDARSASFVSVTQAFNTTTSMGRLTLNVLLSFAQFEREVTGERIRDKIAASKAKGMWMGGAVPLGYDAVDRRLVVNEPEAEQVRALFDLYRGCGAADEVVAEAARRGIRSKRRAGGTGGTVLGRGSLYAMLANPVYAGEIGHGDKRYPGQHQTVVPRETYDAVQALLAGNRRKARGSKAGAASLLSGLVVDADGARMTASHTRKGAVRYRYYSSAAQRVPAADLEALVLAGLAERLGAAERYAALLPDMGDLTQQALDEAAAVAERLRAPATPAMRDLVLDLVEQVTLAPQAVHVRLRLTALGLAGTATAVLPAALGRPKSRLSLVVPGADRPAPDRSLVAAVAQARDWFEELRSGRQTSLAGVAAARGVSELYVRHLIGAAFLAPDIVARIFEGRQPAHLTAARLRELLPLPDDWDAQRALLLGAQGA